MKNIYLCGAINNCTDSECKDWREYTKSALPKHFFRCIDPMKRDYRGKEDGSIAQIVNGDYWDIENSDIVLAYADKPSWGTAMEIHHAFMNLKKYVVVFSNAERPSPWLKYHCHHFCQNIEEALKHIKENFAHGY